MLFSALERQPGGSLGPPQAARLAKGSQAREKRVPSAAAARQPTSPREAALLPELTGAEGRRLAPGSPAAFYLQGNGGSARQRDALDARRMSRRAAPTQEAGRPCSALEHEARTSQSWASCPTFKFWPSPRAPGRRSQVYRSPGRLQVNMVHFAN